MFTKKLKKVQEVKFKYKLSLLLSGPSQPPPPYYGTGSNRVKIGVIGVASERKNWKARTFAFLV